MKALQCKTVNVITAEDAETSKIGASVAMSVYGYT